MPYRAAVARPRLVHRNRGHLTKVIPGNDAKGMNIDYPVIMKRSDEGYAVGCSALPGCWSQGSTEEEAIANIRIAIEEYLEARQSLLADEEDVRTVTISIA